MSQPDNQSVEPPQDAVKSLVESTHLSNSLLLLVTHAPPDFSILTPVLSVIVLRTCSSLSTAETGALQMLSILERAATAAKQWRSSPHGTPQLQQFAEAEAGRAFSISEEVGQQPDGSIPVSTPQTVETKVNRRKSVLSIASLRSVSSSSSFRGQQDNSRPSITAASQSFDAILNFIPALPERAMLKRAVITTTTSQPYLATSVAPLLASTLGSRGHKRKTRAPNRSLPIFSWLAKSSDSLPAELHARRQSASYASSFPTRSGSVASTPATSRSQSPFSADGHSPYPSLSHHRSHIIHVLPASFNHSGNVKPKLVQSLEQFLISYSYEAPMPTIIPADGRSRSRTSSSSSIGSTASSIYSSAGGPTGLQPGLQKPIPYVLSTKVLGSVPATGKGKAPQGTRTSEDLTILELLLLGALDARPFPSNPGQRTLSRMMMEQVPHAWIGQGEDVMIEEGVSMADEHSADSDSTATTSLADPELLAPSSWSPRKSTLATSSRPSSIIRKSSSLNAIPYSSSGETHPESVSTASSESSVNGMLPDSTPATSHEGHTSDTEDSVQHSTDSPTILPSSVPKAPKPVKWKFWKSGKQRS